MYAALRFAVGRHGDFRHPGSSASAAEQQLSPSPPVNGMDVASSVALGTPVALSSPPICRRATCGRDAGL